MITRRHLTLSDRLTRGFRVHQRLETWRLSEGRVVVAASAGGSKHSPHQANPPPEIMKVPTTPPATISIYFRRDGPGDTAVVTPSPERHPHGGAAIGGRVRRYSEDSSEGSFEHGIGKSLVESGKCFVQLDSQRLGTGLGKRGRNS